MAGFARWAGIFGPQRSQTWADGTKQAIRIVPPRDLQVGHANRAERVLLALASWRPSGRRRKDRHAREHVLASRSGPQSWDYGVAAVVENENENEIEMNNTSNKRLSLKFLKVWYPRS